MQPEVHESLLRNVIKALCVGNCSAHVFAFVKTQRVDPTANRYACAANAKPVRASDVEAVLSRFPLASSEIVLGTGDEEQMLLSNLTCRRVRSDLTTGHKPVPPQQKIVGQHLGTQRSWKLLERYEQQNHMRFDFVVRLRTDMRSIRLPSLLTLYTRALNYSLATKAGHSHCKSAIPPVLFSHSLMENSPPDSLNDMIYVAPRQYASPLFNAIKLMRSCPGLAGHGHRYDCCSGSEQLLQCALGHAGRCGNGPFGTASKAHHVPVGGSLIVPARWFLHGVQREKC